MPIVVCDFGHMLESNLVHIRTVGTFQGIMCASRTRLTIWLSRVENWNCHGHNQMRSSKRKTEVKSFKSVNQASHDPGPSEFKERKRFYGSYVYCAWSPSSCRYSTQTQCQQCSLTITRINRILRHCFENKNIRTTLPDVDKSINHLGRYVGLSDAWYPTALSCRPLIKIRI